MIFSFVAACLLLAFPFGSGAFIGPRLQGIDAGLEYQYQYEGRIMAGVGEVGGYREDVYGGRDVVDLAIRSKVKVQRSSAYNVVFQMQDIEVGERKPVDLRCHGLCQDELIYTPIQADYKQQLEKPFLMNTRQNDVEPWLLQVPSREDQWISNIRKSVVHTFDQYLEQVVGEIQDQICVKGFEPVYPIVHKKPSHTIYGHCQAWYSIERTDQIPAMLVSDIQSPITQGSKLPSGHVISEMNHNATYKVVKSIDFDTCDSRNMPKISRTDNGNFTHFERPNSTFAYMDRNSKSEFQVRGEVCGIFRVERVHSESGVAANPSSMQTQRLHTLTRQNMTLESVSPIQQVIQLVDAYRRVDHLSYEAFSPYRAPTQGKVGQQVTWVRYNTTASSKALPQYLEQGLLGANGVEIDYEEAIKQVKDDMKSLVEGLRSTNKIFESKSSTGLKTTSMGNVVMKLHAIQRIVSLLNKGQIKDLVRSFSSSVTEKTLLLDTLAASSSGPAMEVVLELITPGQPGYDSTITDSRKASLLLQASDNIPDPKIIPQLVRFLKTLNIEKSGVPASIALIAGTKVLRQLCSIHQEDQFSYPKELYGEEQCNVQDLVNDYIPYLRTNMMENQTNSFNWKHRVSFLQAYVMLGLNVDLSSLQHVVKYDSDKMVRTTAVFGMGRRYLPLSQRDAAIKVLLTNVRSLNMTNELRQSAVATLVSWAPEQWVWDELAAITTLPSSFNIAPYIVSTMRSFAYGTDKGSQQSKFAHKSLHKAKPVSTTTDWSHSWTGTSNDTNAQRGIQYNQAWINRNGTQVPDQTYLNLAGSANELDQRIVEIIQQFEDFNKTGPYIPFLFARSHNQQGEPKMKLQVKALNTDIFAPGTLKDLGISSDTPFPVLDLLLKHISPCYVKSGQEIVQFYQPKVKELFVPSEIGLPVVFKIISPSILYARSDSVRAQCGDTKGTYSAKYDLKFAMKHTTLLEVFGPFVQKKIASGVDNEKGLTLPIIVNGSYNRTHSASQFGTGNRSPIGNLPQNLYCQQDNQQTGCNSFIMSMQSHSYQQSPIPVVFQQITPFTVKKSLRPGSEFLGNDSPIRPIFEKVNFIRENLPLIQQYTGVNTTLAFEGDEPSPLNWATVAKYFYNPSKVMEIFAADSNKYSRLSLLVDPSTSTNTEATFSSFYETVRPDGPGATHRHTSYANQATYVGLGAKFSRDDNYISTVNMNNVMANSGSKVSVHQQSEVKLDSGSYVDIMRPVSYKENFISYFTIPLPKSLKDLQSQLSSNQVSNITGSLQWNRNTSSTQYSPRVVAQTNISIGLSDERRNWLVQNIPEVGVQDHEEPEVALNARANYDEIYMLHKWNQGFSSLSQFWQRTLKRARNVAYGWNFPQFVTDLPIVKDQKEPANIFVNRTFSDTWQGYCYDCSPSWTLYDMVTRPELDMAFFSLVKGRRQMNFGNSSNPWPPMHGMRVQSGIRRSSPIVSGLDNELKTCLTDNSRVITYDGLTFAKLPNKCYQLLTADCAHPSSDWHVFAMSPFRAPNDRITYLRYISPEADVIVGGDSFLMINGKKVPMEQLAHSKAMVMSKRSNAVIGECVQKEFAVVQCTLYHKVVLAPTRSMGRVQLLNNQQSMCGLCGNNNGVASDDRMGNKCMYKDMHLMAASLTSNLQCSQQPSLEQQIKQAERFENSQQCTPVRQLRPWGSKLPSLPWVAMPQQPTPYPQRKVEGSRMDHGPLMSHRWTSQGIH